MNKHFSLLIGSITVAGLLAGCTGSADSSPPRQAPAAAQAAPTVAEAARHYADLVARGTPLLPSADCRFAGVEPVRRPAPNTSTEYSASLTWTLQACEVGGLLDQQQRLFDVTIEVPLSPEPVHPIVKYTPRRPAQLVRLGELRRVFGPGTNATAPEEAGEYYFTYRPVATARKLTIQAFLSGEARTDSAAVDRIAIFIAPPQ